MTYFRSIAVVDALGRVWRVVGRNLWLMPETEKTPRRVRARKCKGKVLEFRLAN